MDDESLVAHYDPAAGRLRLRLDGGEEVAIGGLRELSFRMGGSGEPLRAPLWLSASQADVLGKMIAHILDKVRISPASQQVLEGLRQPVADLKDELEAAAEESWVAGPEPESP